MDSTPHTQHGHQVSAATATAIVGGALVVVAIIALVSANWSQFNSWTRILTLAAPLIALYLTGLGLHNKPVFHELKIVALLTANIAFPFVAGVTYFELSGKPMLDAGFYAVVLGITSLWYLIWEFGGNLRENTPLTLVAFTFWLFSIAGAFQTTTWINTLALLGVSVLAILASTVIWRSNKTNFQSRLYLCYGMLLLTFNLFYAPAQWANVLAIPELVSWFTQIGYIVMGIVILLMATVAASAWQMVKDEIFFSAREFLENIGLFGLVAMPAIFALFMGAHDQELLIDITAILAALIGFTLSHQVKIKGLRNMSALALLLVFARFVVQAFNTVEISWPILILIIGALLFVLAILMASRNQLSTGLVKWYKQEPTGSFFGLGEQRQKEHLQSTSDTYTTEVKRADGTVVKFVNKRGSESVHNSLAGTFLIMMVLLLISLACSASWWFSSMSF